jgi:Mg-chelatase subunit ChlD
LFLFFFPVFFICLFGTVVRLHRLVLANPDGNVRVAVIDLHSPVIDIAAANTTDGAARTTEPQGKDVILCVDVSGSMQPAMDAVRRTVMKVFEALSPNDRIGLVTFTDSAATELAVTEVRALTAERMQQVADKLKATNSTNLGAGISTAIQAVVQAMKPAEQQQRPRMTLIAVLSDGQPNIGETSEMGLINFTRKEMRRVDPMQTPPLVVIHSFVFSFSGFFFVLFCATNG